MKRVCALGFFDGVHLGHAEIIRKAIGIAKERGISPAVVTFDNKPKNMAGATRLLNDAETKKDMIRTLFGDIEIIELKFTDKLKNTSAADFTARCLIEKLGAVCAVVGENFRFGKGAEGTPETLEKALDTAVVKTVAVAGETVSSTAIRALISEGNIEKANLFLGHPHVVSGRVSHGDARGRKLGIATLNLRMPEGIVRPKAGVYVTRTLIEGVRYGSITNFGARADVLPRRAVPFGDTCFQLPGGPLRKRGQAPSLRVFKTGKEIRVAGRAPRGGLLGHRNSEKLSRKN